MKYFKNRRGEGYVDLAVGVLIVCFLLVFLINAASLVALNQNLKTVANHLCDYACSRGTTDVSSYAGELRDRTGIDFSCDFSESAVMGDGTRVQLGDPVVCRVTCGTSFPGFGEVFHPLTLGADATGLSRVYWK